MKIIDVEPIISDLIKVRKMWDKDVLYENGICAGISSALNRLNNAPIVEPKRGEWVGDKCSMCGNERAWYGCNPPFCPDCGADMREKDDE